MSKAAPYQDDQKLGADLPRECPPGQVSDSSYKTSGRTATESVPVVDDNAPVEDPMKLGKADSDEQLEQDEREAIDKGNIMKGRTRGAKPMGGTYKEPTDEQMMGLGK